MFQLSESFKQIVTVFSIFNKDIAIIEFSM